MRPVATNDLVAWCQSVCHAAKLCQNGWTDLDAVHVANVGDLLNAYPTYQRHIVLDGWGFRTFVSIPQHLGFRTVGGGAISHLSIVKYVYCTRCTRTFLAIDGKLCDLMLMFWKVRKLTCFMYPSHRGCLYWPPNFLSVLKAAYFKIFSSRQFIPVPHIPCVALSHSS